MAPQFSDASGSSMPARKAMIIATAFMLTNFLGAGLLGLKRSNLGWVAFTVALAFAVYRALIKCPRCAWPLLRRRVQIAGVDWTYYYGVIGPRKCIKCGLDLTS
jgi:hypothetical protein